LDSSKRNSLYRAFAVHHLLHFFSLYRPYLPLVEEIIPVPIVVVGEEVLY
jgi:hypothetical protein